MSDFKDKKDNYSQKKVLYNPKTSSIFLLVIGIGLIYLFINNESARNLLVQSVEKVTQMMSK